MLISMKMDFGLMDEFEHFSRRGPFALVVDDAFGEKAPEVGFHVHVRVDPTAKLGHAPALVRPPAVLIRSSKYLYAVDTAANAGSRGIRARALWS